MTRLLLALSCLLPASALAEDAALPPLPGIDAAVQAGQTSMGQVVSVQGQPFVINGMNQVLSHACGSNGSPDVVINGMGSTITLTGECGEVVINGTTLKVSIASVRELTVGGMTNAVVYSAPAGGETAVTNAGMGNAVEAKPR